MSDENQNVSKVFRKDEIQQSNQPYRLTIHPGLEPLEVVGMERKRLEIKTKIARDASRKIEESRVRAREEIERAEEDAEDILKAARDEAKVIVEGARQQEKAITEEARKRGYNQARDAARKEALDGIETTLKILDAGAAEVKALRKNFLIEANSGMADVIAAAAERILKGSITIDEGLVMRTLQEASTALVSADRISLRIHPEDLLTVESRKDEIYSLIKGLTELDLHVDTGVARGGLIIETSFGRVDARLESQIAELLRSVRIAIRDSALSEEIAVQPAVLTEAETPSNGSKE